MRDPSRTAALVVLAGAVLTIGGALVSEHVFGLVPCKLCLTERWPYYLGIPVALAAFLVPDPRARRAALALLAVIFVGSLGLGAFHAGAEWSFWPGPGDCGGGQAPATGIEDLLKGLDTIRVVSCTDAAWRFTGISLAGWNAVASLLLAGIAAWGAVSSPGWREEGAYHGSNSVSQYR